LPPPRGDKQVSELAFPRQGSIESQEGLRYPGESSLRWSGVGPRRPSGGDMLRRTVPLVAGEAVAVGTRGEVDEEAVAVDLGQDAGGGDERLIVVAVNEGLLRARPVRWCPRPSMRRKSGLSVSLLDGHAHGKQRGLANIDAVDGLGIDRGDGPGYRVRANLDINWLRFFSVSFLSPVRPCSGSLLAESLRRDHRAEERSRPTSSSPAMRSVHACAQLLPAQNHRRGFGPWISV